MTIIGYHVKKGGRGSDEILTPRKGRTYVNIEKLVFWARSEATGCAVDKCRGVMEYWNVGIMGS
jgi:hypothetical protein